MLSLYGSLLSPYVRKAVIALQIKKMAYEFVMLHPLIEEQKKELLKLSPLGKIPILKADETIIPDSSIICAYLEKKKIDLPIYPNQPEHYAKSLWFEEYSDTELSPTLITIFVNSFTAKAMGKEPNQEALDNAINIKIPAIFHYLNQEITGHTYLAGETLSIADISIAASLMTYFLLNNHVAADVYPHFAHYVEQLFQHPIIAAINNETISSFKAKYAKKDVHV